MSDVVDRKSMDRTRSAPAIESLAGGEIPGLDGLRAFSVLSVMISHYGFGKIIPGGLGVTVFFFISGFLITTLMLREYRATGGISIRQFYLRRLLRLQPELWIMLVVTTALGSFYNQISWPRNIDFASAFFYFTNYYDIYMFTTNSFGSPRWPLLWSLAIEEHFYLIYPAIFLIMIRNTKHFIRYLAIMLVVELIYRLILNNSGMSKLYIYLATDTRLDSIGYGCLTALLFWYCPPRLVDLMRRHGGAIGALGLAVLLIALVYRNADFRDTWRYSFIGAALMLIFACFYASPGGVKFTNALEIAPLKWLGRMSYGAYLWQLEVAGFLWRVVGITWYDAPSVKAAVSALVFCIATFGVAAISFELLQKPFRSLRHRLRS